MFNLGAKDLLCDLHACSAVWTEVRGVWRPKSCPLEMYFRDKLRHECRPPWATHSDRCGWQSIHPCKLQFFKFYSFFTHSLQFFLFPSHPPPIFFPLWNWWETEIQRLSEWAKSCHRGERAYSIFFSQCWLWFINIVPFAVKFVKRCLYLGCFTFNSRPWLLCQDLHK